MERNLLPKKQRESSKSSAYRVERSHAKKLGAKSHPASGASLMGGDCSNNRFLFDSKSTRTKSLRISDAEVHRVCTQARHQGKHPAVVLELKTEVVTTPSTWVCIPLEVFNQLTGGLGEEYS